jgi:hypothetical protein
VKFQQASLIAAFSLAAHVLAWIAQGNAQVKPEPNVLDHSGRTIRGRSLRD